MFPRQTLSPRCRLSKPRAVECICSTRTQSRGMLLFEFVFTLMYVYPKTCLEHSSRSTPYTVSPLFYHRTLCALLSVEIVCNFMYGIFLQLFCVCLCLVSAHRQCIAVHISLLNNLKPKSNRVDQVLQRIVQFEHLVVSVCIQSQQTPLIIVNFQHDPLQLPDQLSLCQPSKRYNIVLVKVFKSRLVVSTGDREVSFSDLALSRLKSQLNNIALQVKIEQIPQ